jgi:hypothetical protein
VSLLAGRAVNTHVVRFLDKIVARYGVVARPDPLVVILAALEEDAVLHDQ